MHADCFSLQAEQIDNIETMTVESHENVSEGNEQVRKVSTQCGLCWSMVCDMSAVLRTQAIKSRASLRIWILFVLIVLSFALLFLDWYS